MFVSTKRLSRQAYFCRKYVGSDKDVLSWQTPVCRDKHVFVATKLLSLLKDKLFANEINHVIRTVIEEYAALPYSREQLPFIPKCDIQFVISDQLFLDVLLMKIRSKTISYATMKKRVDQEKERDLQNNIQSLETKIKLTEDEKGKLESYQQELIALREKKMEGFLLRSRSRWVAEGEKITIFLCT